MQGIRIIQVVILYFVDIYFNEEDLLTHRPQSIEEDFYKKMGLSEFTSNESRPFIERSNCRLKCVFLIAVRNVCTSIPIGHYNSMNEEYETISLGFKNYKLTPWQQRGYKKYRCLLYLWDSRAHG